MKFDADELKLIDSALEHAITDTENYLSSGDAEIDYEMCPEDLERYKKLPDEWLNLRKKILERGES